MFNSTMLEIVIGLIFIFLLYSLLATVITELIATFFGLRARNLSRAISRMLEDDNRKGELTKAFFNQAIIKYLAPGKWFKKPSYISPDNFAFGVIEILKDMGEGRSDIEKVKSVLDNTLSEESQKYNAARRLLQDASISETQKIASIQTLINSPLIKNEFSSSETGGFIRSLLNDAQQDLQKFKALLEKWFDDTMERTVGWYKRKIQLILLGIGFIIAVSFNASTLQIVKSLSNDKNAREQMVQLASAYIESNPEIITALDSLPDEFERKLDTLLSIRNDLESDIDKTTGLLGLGWKLPDSLGTVPLSKGKRKYKQSSLLINGTDSFLIQFKDPALAELNNDYYKLESIPLEEGKKEAKTYFAKLNRSKYFLGTLKQNLIGYIITALAISLGASFWFDLLNKLVNLRNSVQSPGRGESKSKKGVTTSILDRKG